MPVHFADLLVAFTPGPGDPPVQSKSTVPLLRVRTGAPDRSVLLKNWPVRPVPLPEEGVSALVGTVASAEAVVEPCAYWTLTPDPARALMPAAA